MKRHLGHFSCSHWHCWHFLWVKNGQDWGDFVSVLEEFPWLQTNTQHFQEQQNTLTLPFVQRNVRYLTTILWNNVTRVLFVFNITKHSFPYRRNWLSTYSPNLTPVWKGKSASGRKIKMLLTRTARGGLGCTGHSPDLSLVIASRKRKTTVRTNCITCNVLLQRMCCLIFPLLVHPENEKVLSWQLSLWSIGKVI